MYGLHDESITCKAPERSAFWVPVFSKETFRCRFYNICNRNNFRCRFYKICKKNLKRRFSFEKSSFKKTDHLRFLHLDLQKCSEQQWWIKVVRPSGGGGIARLKLFPASLLYIWAKFHNSFHWWRYAECCQN